jgi:hypothetical protein
MSTAINLAAKQDSITAKPAAHLSLFDYSTKFRPATAFLVSLLLSKESANANAVSKAHSQHYLQTVLAVEVQAGEAENSCVKHNPCCRGDTAAANN